VGNLGLLFMLLFFIYAALGVELFGELVCNADYPCEGMSRHATFENFGMAFLTLFQVSTGDNWNGIMKDTLRECPPDHPVTDYECHAGLQFISPMYFVSFVLTAQFVLINVVVAVLMKHLDDSNKEAQEDAEMDAEIELELAQGGLCCLAGIGGAVDSFEGDMIDNLSGSVFHHYCPPPVCKDCKDHPQEIQLAEVEQASLRSEQMSDKSSSPALPDDLSLDEHSCYQMLVRYSQRGSSDSHSSEELPTQGCYRGILPSSSGSEEGVQELYEVGVHPQVNSPSLEQQSPAPCTGGDGGSRGEGGSSPVFHLPADFFHPAAVAHPGRPRTRVGPGDRGPSRPRTRVGPGDRGPSRPPSLASWASLRSAGADSRPLSSQVL
ncbi:hypothetical protein KUCAC02_037382, partial [Chaenocephalus aceratus]